MPASKKGVHYAFISAPPETRWSASRSLPKAPLALGGAPLREGPSQRADVRPGTDWTFLMSAPAFRFGPNHKEPRKVVQRPWPEYVPESSAPLGRSWSNHSLSDLHEGRRYKPTSMGYASPPKQKRSFTKYALPKPKPIHFADPLPGLIPGYRSVSSFHS